MERGDQILKTKGMIGVLILLLVGGVYFGLDAAKQSKAKGQTKAPSNASENLSKGSTGPIIDDQGGFQVGAEWLKEEGAEQQVFTISLNNHAVNVDDFDFKSNLKVSINNQELPIQVEVLDKEATGHHVSAKLKIESPEFTQVTSGSVLTLRVENVYNTPNRSFSWTY